MQIRGPFHGTTLTTTLPKRRAAPAGAGSAATTRSHVSSRDVMVSLVAGSHAALARSLEKTAVVVMPGAPEALRRRRGQGC